MLARLLRPAPGGLFSTMVFHPRNRRGFSCDCENSSPHVDWSRLGGTADARLQALGKELGVEVISFQTNGEKVICDRIHRGFEEKSPRCSSTPARGRTTATASATHQSVFAEVVKGQICGF